ncbi:hypothetical protein SISSUDRAFT_1119420 [Sistotremastrum suecicum HHB10207 ss-3]|uniref:Uncharacterized protein n=1 Tax=Sistotremastrum suecicum HHB10207 ss-3 TaxID=1314776 RepID=A0A166DQH6_9AGAM|nr:hypothetical protein SISSUDRAFT_1119420 [Sistotremastrum suecicum HHB10207 ss-3]
MSSSVELKKLESGFFGIRYSCRLIAVDNFKTSQRGNRSSHSKLMIMLTIRETPISAVPVGTLMELRNINLFEEPSREHYECHFAIQIDIGIKVKKWKPRHSVKPKPCYPERYPREMVLPPLQNLIRSPFARMEFLPSDWLALQSKLVYSL